VGKELTSVEAAALAEAHEAKVSAEQDRQFDDLSQRARATLRAVQGWQGVRSEGQWAQVQAKALDDHRTGRFLIEELGAERVLHPKQVAVLLQLRDRLLAQHDPEDAAQAMLIDLAIVAYYNALRIQGWIGNLSLVLERELFGQDALRAVHGDGQGETIEDKVEQLGGQLLPLLDRASRMMLRNLKALDELHRGPAPSVSVGQAGQVNVGQQQVNVTNRRSKRRKRSSEA
jgi:hypothetical protein